MKNISRLILVFIVTFVFTDIAYSGDKRVASLSREDAHKKAITHQTRGNAFEDEGKFNDAITEYKESLKYSPDDVNTLFNLGVVYLKANKANEAVTAFERIVKLAPKDTEAYNLLGIAYKGSGNEIGAKKAWEKSLAIDPNQAQVKKMMQDSVQSQQ
ncbi:MAG: tetratricopeptide repeat protein [Deltaproteobacteria bacterium]|nr:tetratricopeptide repeat protein [Deltaproteobacteria bacterium]